MHECVRLRLLKVSTRTSIRYLVCVLNCSAMSYLLKTLVHMTANGWNLNRNRSEVAACCSVLQHVAACCSVLQHVAVCCSVSQCVAVRCSALQGDIISIYSGPSYILRRMGEIWIEIVPKLQRVAACCSMLQCVAACCSMLQCVAVRCSVMSYLLRTLVHITANGSTHTTHELVCVVTVSSLQECGTCATN